MISKTLLAGATALTLALPALAQTTSPPPASQQQQQTPSASPSTAARGNLQFIERQQGDQWLASRFMDRSVYGTDGSTIGDVNDVLVDRNGQVVAVVIGVGGFLGIGEKNVAVPFRMLEIQPAPARTTDTTTSTTPGTTTNTQAPATTTAPSGTNTAMGDLWSDRNARLVLRATRDELRNAPTFAEADDRSARTDDNRTRTNTDSNTNRAPAGSPSTPAR